MFSYSYVQEIYFVVLLWLYGERQFWVDAFEISQDGVYDGYDLVTDNETINVSIISQYLLFIKNI
jgi:hypothetical protein